MGLEKKANVVTADNIGIQYIAFSVARGRVSARARSTYGFMTFASIVLSPTHSRDSESLALYPLPREAVPNVNTALRTPNS
eukprot:scaffold122747_cov48-Phaeocystis_antarctica.AAC.2